MGEALRQDMADTAVKMTLIEPGMGRILLQVPPRATLWRANDVARRDVRAAASLPMWTCNDTVADNQSAERERSSW